jgi:Cys-tRNA(Pro) deacylase
MATDHPVTMAIRVLRQHKVEFTAHLYAWEAHGGTAASALHLGADEHCVVKTLIFEDQNKQPLCVLMHGDREVSAKNLARQLGVKSVAPCAPAVADRHSGYQVGGTSPFGLKRRMPICCAYSNPGSWKWLLPDGPDDAIVERAENAAAAGVAHLDGDAVAKLQERRARRAELELLERALLGEAARAAASAGE